MLFLASKPEELFENLDVSEYNSRYRVPFGQLHLWRKQLLSSRQHKRLIARYLKNGFLGVSTLGDVSVLPLRCASAQCEAEATQGCHVKYSDCRKKKQLVVPLCPSCNAAVIPFQLKPLTPLLLLGSTSSKSPEKMAFVEARIRFLHHSITLNLPTPSK